MSEVDAADEQDGECDAERQLLGDKSRRDEEADPPPPALDHRVGERSCGGGADQGEEVDGPPEREAAHIAERARMWQDKSIQTS